MCLNSKQNRITLPQNIDSNQRGKKLNKEKRQEKGGGKEKRENKKDLV